jgi:hypothetical protein
MKKMSGDQQCLLNATISMSICTQTILVHIIQLTCYAYTMQPRVAPLAEQSPAVCGNQGTISTFQQNSSFVITLFLSHIFTALLSTI